jgi:hypothetical protein
MASQNKKEKQKRIDLGVLGFSGLKQYAGSIDEEWHPRLRGDYGPKVYREMTDNSSTIGAINFIIDALVRQVEWRVEPAEPSKEAQTQAQFVEECLTDMSLTFEDLISEVLSMFPYGWSYFELVYKLRKGWSQDSTTKSKFDDGRFGWRKIALRAQDTLERWQFAEDGSLEGMHQVDYTSGKSAFVPIAKAVLFRTRTTKNNPEGRSLYRNAVVDYYYLKRICEIEAIGIERDMTGLLTMQVPVKMLHTDASAQDKALLSQLQTLLAELKRDEREYAIIPSKVTPEGKATGFVLELLSTGGKRQIDTNAVKQYYKVGMLQSVLAQFIQLGMQNVGSFALASSQTDLFAVALGAYLDVISATFNRFAISKLMVLNGVKPEVWPELVHGDLESVPLAEIGAYVQALATAGQLPEDDAIQRKLLEIAKLPMPEKEEGEEVKKQRKPGGLTRQWTEKVIPGGVPTPRPKKTCPKCGKEYLGNPTKCPYCGYVLVQAAIGE